MHIRKIRQKQLESREDNASILRMFSKDEMWNAPFKMCIKRKGILKCNLSKFILLII